MNRAKIDGSYARLNEWVVVRRNGRVGLVRDVTPRKVLVQFGADGPFESYFGGRLRRATQDEIDKATGVRS